MLYKFKKGDRIERIIGSKNGMKVGDKGIVSKDINTDDFNDFIELNFNGFNTKGFVSSFKLISSNYIAKCPTHIVIWEEDEDPLKFFTSDKKAKEFIRELSLNNDVEKDSIILVEIKTCKKIKIKTSLEYTNHKI